MQARTVIGVVCFIGMSAASGMAQAPPVQYKTTYNGGTLRDFKNGAALKLSVDRDSVRLIGNEKDAKPVVVDAISVTAISYSQDASHMFVPGVGVSAGGVAGGVGIGAGIGVLSSMARSQKHYIGIAWERDTRESIVLKVGANDWRGICADLEAATRLRINGARR